MSSTDEDDDIVVLQVCERCNGIEDLQFDEEMNVNYCARCRDVFSRTETEGFRILLSGDDLLLVQMIMDKFDEKKKGFWSYEEWNEFCSYTSQGGDGKVESDEELEQFFKEEFDIALSKKDGRFVVSLEDIENMYGGFQYNDVNALAEDADALDSAGITNTGILE